MRKHKGTVSHEMLANQDWVCWFKGTQSQNFLLQFVQIVQSSNWPFYSQKKRRLYEYTFVTSIRWNLCKVKNAVQFIKIKYCDSAVSRPALIVTPRCPDSTRLDSALSGQFWVCSKNANIFANSQKLAKSLDISLSRIIQFGPENLVTLHL